MRLGHDLFETDEGSTADEEDIAGIDVLIVLQLTGEPSMIFNSACCTLSPEVARDSAGVAFSLSISSMKMIPCWAFSTFPSAFSSSRCKAASISH
jgi:hypothetical protein